LLYLSDLVKAVFMGMVLVCLGCNPTNSRNPTAVSTARAGSAQTIQYRAFLFLSVWVNILFQEILFHWCKQDQAICHHLY